MAKKNVPPEIQPEDILRDHSPEVRLLAERLRKLVLETVPSASEAAYPHWHGIGYRHPQAGYFCAIFPQADHINLSFEFGVLLPDPEHVLKGTGKQVRFIPIHTEEDIQEEAIKALLQAALDLPSKRGTKLWLIQNSARPLDNQDEA